MRLFDKHIISIILNKKILLTPKSKIDISMTNYYDNIIIFYIIVQYQEREKKQKIR